MIARQGMTYQDGICSTRIERAVSLVAKLRLFKGTVFHFKRLIVPISSFTDDSDLTGTGNVVLPFTCFAHYCLWGRPIRSTMKILGVNGLEQSLVHVIIAMNRLDVLKVLEVLDKLQNLAGNLLIRNGNQIFRQVSQFG